MNEQEALKYMTLFRNEWDVNSKTKNAEAIDVTIKSLKKQIPKKPIYSEFDDNGNVEIIPYKAECQTCGYEFEFGTFNENENHHCICGQKLDWEGGAE